MATLPLTRKDLEAAVNAGRRFKYVFFWGHRKARSGEVTSSCFSQWHEAPFELDGHRYGSAEHYMMAEKARLFGDDEVLQRILTVGSPGAAKALGREVRGFDEAKWRENRFDIVVAGNLTNYWHAGVPSKWRGENLLGFALMAVRERL